MKQLVISLACLLITIGRVHAQDILIVADEIPAMEVLARGFNNRKA
ncbi:hypothetical protein [Spirosoma telluris]